MVKVFKCLIFIILFYCLFYNVSPQVQLYPFTPRNTTSCVVAPEVLFEFYTNQSWSDCHLWANNTGVFESKIFQLPLTAGVNQFYYNFTIVPNTILWRVHCESFTPAEDEYSDNFTFTLTDAPYCAVLAETSCKKEVNLGGEGLFKTRLSNTNGIYLENQDCNVWVEDSSGEVVKKFNNMLYSQKVTQVLDDEGNWINIVNPDVPVTDSQGWYVFNYPIFHEWAWYGEEYTLKAVCNGQITSCDFNVTKARLPDVNEMRALGKEAGGIIFLIILACVGLLYAIKTGRIQIQR